MGKPIKGDVVVVPFPFSDLTQSKRRPALVLANLKGDDLILCQITSQHIIDDYSVTLSNDDFEIGSLNVVSNVRPNRIFTADKKIVLYKVGQIKKNKLTQIINKLIEIVK